MAENIILLFALSTLTLAGLTSQQYSGVTSSCSGLQSKHEFGNFSVGQRFATGKLYKVHPHADKQNYFVLRSRVCFMISYCGVP